MFKSYREQSKRNWGSDHEDPLTVEQVNCGALLRIADATEKMAQSYQQLISERDSYKKGYEDRLARIEKLKKSNAALRGQITRLKKRFEKADEEAGIETQQVQGL